MNEETVDCELTPKDLEKLSGGAATDPLTADAKQLPEDVKQPD